MSDVEQKIISRLQEHIGELKSFVDAAANDPERTHSVHERTHKDFDEMQADAARWRYVRKQFVNLNPSSCGNNPHFAMLEMAVDKAIAQEDESDE